MINKHFSTIIITRKHIIIAILIITLILVSSSIIKNTKKAEALCSANLSDEILSLELNQKTNDKGLIKKVVSKIIGFDINKKETILLNYSKNIPIDTEYDQKDYILPTKKVEEKKIQQAPKVINQTTTSKGLAITNTAKINVDTSKLISQKLAYKLDDNGPQVLIFHTHTTESYDQGDNTNRSTDSSKNMISVGKILCEKLKSKGIKTIHDATVHDYPSYSGAYTRSKATVSKNLEKYPSIKVVLDLHRDGIEKSDGSKVKVSCKINGESVSQCMFVVGTNKELSHDYWCENMKLALKIQEKANEKYPNLMRPINLRSERFNQQLSKGALIIEVGSNGNTLEESKKAIGYLGDVIAEVLNEK